jgi:hypothetical protein
MDRLRKKREKLGREVRQSLGKQLRGVYHDFVSRPLPRRLLELLWRLERSEASSAMASSHKEESSKNRGG